MAPKTVGVISDTHGLVRPQALDALAGSDLILHGGDIGKPAVLEALEQIAPVIAIRGNVDRDPWFEAVPWTRDLELEGCRIHLLHNLSDLETDRPADLYDAIVFGHSHKALNELSNSVLYFNPGSAGPRRFRLPVTLGRLHLDDRSIRGEILELEV